VKRREFITLLGSAAAWPLAVRAQQAGKVVRIGFIGASLNSPAMAGQYQAFLTELRELGFGEGQNVIVDYRRIDDPRGPFAIAAELMRLQVDLVVATGPEVALQAVVGASRSIPIVILAVHMIRLRAVTSRAWLVPAATSRACSIDDRNWRQSSSNC
jgi:putative tryptophan/tyrosine transport system substrate-binding protein